jgi:hypothetical protein
VVTIDDTPEAGARTFFRIVGSDPPTLHDFLSNTALGRQPRYPLDVEARELWDGISVYASWARARRKAGTSPWLGSFIAELRIPPDTSVVARRTTTSREHWTLWAEAQVLLDCVVSVLPL